MDEAAKTNKLQALEQSLISFLLNKKEVEEKIGSGYRRIRMLSLKLNDKDPSHVTLVISMGMVTSEFNITNGLKERGNCLGLERFIREWTERDVVKCELLSLTSKNKGGAGADLSTNVRNTIR